MMSNHIKKSIGSFIRTRNRLIHTSLVDRTAQKSPLFQLRQRTGLAYSLCREALNKHDNDVEQADAWLKAHALAHGLQRASKVRDRNTKEGLIGLAIRDDSKMVTVLELNCETDFVAKNQTFKDFALGLTEDLASIEDCRVKQIEGTDNIQELLISEEPLKLIENKIAPLIARLGENIRVLGASHFQVKDDVTRLYAQIHASSGRKDTDNLNVMTGRFGSIVAIQSTAEKPIDVEAMRPSGNRLCRHVIGYSPTYIELPDIVRKHLEAAEKEKSLLEAESNELSARCDGPDELENSNSSSNYKDDWPSIMDHTLIMSEDQTVREFCRDNEISIVFFRRFECGASQ